MARRLCALFQHSRPHWGVASLIDVKRVRSNLLVDRTLAEVDVLPLQSGPQLHGVRRFIKSRSSNQSMVCSQAEQTPAFVARHDRPRDAVIELQRTHAIQVETSRFLQIDPSICRSIARWGVVVDLVGIVRGSFICKL